jgi:hypothetical protein
MTTNSQARVGRFLPETTAAGIKPVAGPSQVNAPPNATSSSALSHGRGHVPRNPITQFAFDGLALLMAALFVAAASVAVSVALFILLFVRT